MAEKLTGSDEPKRSRRKERQNNMISNISEIRKASFPLMEKLLTMQKDMDADAAGWRSDFKNTYAEGAKEIGCKPALLKKMFREILANLRDEEEEQEMEAVDREQWEKLAASFSGTPFEDYCKGQLAEPKITH